MIVSFEWKRILLEACVLVAFGALFGLTVNNSMVMDALNGQLVPQTTTIAEESAGFPVPVLLQDVQEIISGGGAIIDARSPELYAAGHIPGAISLPLAELDEHMASFFTNVAKDRVLVIYCSGYGCPDSFDLGVLLIEAGYADVRVFEGGFPEWRDAGFGILKGAQ